MRKYLLCAILAAAMLLTGIPAHAANETSIITPSELTQLIPSDLLQKLWSGETLSESERTQVDGRRISLRENRGACYIVSVWPSDSYERKTGVFDFSSGKWLIPCVYDEVFPIPENRYFLLNDPKYLGNSSITEPSVCYEAEADGTINPEPLPINGNVCNVDEEGYVTLYQYVLVQLKNGGEGPYTKRALLDNHYQMVLDYIAETQYPQSIPFLNGVAVIRTGNTSFESTGKGEMIAEGGTYGIINRHGEWVGRHDYEEMYHIVEEANARILCRRGDAWYQLTETGEELPLPLMTSWYDFPDLCSDWARDAIEQARTRSLIPEQIDSYYTLDILREEFCSLLMNLYRALGKTDPSLNSAPTFTDCSLADVRAAAALGVVSGYDDGTFRPRERITREEAAAMLSRFTALFRENDESIAEPYRDDAQIGSWAKPQVYAMRNAGIMSGTDGGFSPKGAYTIEQAISVANRLYNLLKGV